MVAPDTGGWLTTRLGMMRSDELIRRVSRWEIICSATSAFWCSRSLGP